MKKNVVCIGGGNGASQIMQGLKPYDVDITGIIAVTDSGRSTGKIRIAAGIPAPGDIRNALISLSTADPFLQELFQFRFRSPKLADLDGMAFGNLFIAALSQMTDSFKQAVDKTAEFLKVKGTIIPIMLSDTHIACEREDGTIDKEEVNIRTLGKSPIKRMFLVDETAVANKEALKAIRKADLVTLGPGSLFTTVIACLLTPDVPEELAKTKAKVVMVMNTTRQPGQTDFFSMADHLKILQSYLPKKTIDVCIVNTKEPSTEQVEKLKEEGLTYMSVTKKDRQEMEKMGVKVITAKLIETYDPTRELWNKQDTICHDPEKIANEILTLLA